MTLRRDDRLTDPEDFRFAIETGDGSTPPALCFTEYLAWHVETFPEDMAPLLTPEGWLTAEALAGVEEVIRAEFVRRNPAYADRPLCIEDGFGGDDPNFTILMDLAVPLGGSEDAAWEDAWPLMATCINITDPGTFNFPYLFTQVTRALERRGCVRARELEPGQVIDVEPLIRAFCTPLNERDRANLMVAESEAAEVESVETREETRDDGERVEVTVIYTDLTNLAVPPETFVQTYPRRS